MTCLKKKIGSKRDRFSVNKIKMYLFIILFNLSDVKLKYLCNFYLLFVKNLTSIWEHRLKNTTKKHFCSSRSVQVIKWNCTFANSIIVNINHRVLELNAWKIYWLTVKVFLVSEPENISCQSIRFTSGDDSLWVR